MKSLGGFFIAFVIIVFFIAFLATPARESSSLENRTLTQLPSFSLSSFVDGSFQKKINSYFSDQFPLRDFFVKFDLTLDRLGQNTAGADYDFRVEGSDGYDYYVYEDELILALLRDKKNLDVAGLWTDKLGEASKWCADAGVDMAVAIFPSKAEALIQMEPEFHRNNSDSAVLDRVFDDLPDSVLKIDGVEEFRKLPLDELRDRYLKRDNHWNFYGAQCAYAWMLPRLADRFDLRVAERNFVSVPNVQQRMVGAYARTVGFDDPREERLEFFIPDDAEFDVEYYYDGETLLTDPAAAAEVGTVAEVRLPTNASAYSSYEVWLDGEQVGLNEVFCKNYVGDNVDYSNLTMMNNAWVKIRNEEADNDYVLLVVHDSFYNAIALNMSLSVSEQHIVDTRTYKDFNLAEFVRENNVEGVLFFYNSNAFFKIEDHLSFDVQ